MGGESGLETKPRQRLFFLFNDVLIVAKHTANNKYGLRMWIDLSKIWVDNSHTAKGNAVATADAPSSSGGAASAAPPSSTVDENVDASKRGDSLNPSMRTDRAFPLQIVCISGSAETQEPPSRASVRMRILHKTSKRRRNGSTRNNDGIALSPRVEHLILWFHSASKRREAQEAIESASKELKNRREHLAKMQKTSGKTALETEESYGEAYLS